MKKLEYPGTVVYHASPMQGLEELAPRISSHGLAWVYAAGDPTVAALFLGRLGGDFTCGVGASNGMPYVVERFARALEARYLGRSGSIYTLPAGDFAEGLTTWKQDLVCDHTVRPIREDRIPNAFDYLHSLAQDGKLLIKRYPERFCIPDDDQDLVERAIARYIAGNVEILDRLQKWHPQLVERVRRGILEQEGAK